MKTNKIFLIFISLLFMVLISSCQYNEILTPPASPPPDSTVVISFSQQIEPIFGTEKCTSCHPSQHLPDLSVGNSYASIIGTNLVNTSDPESSTIYWYPNPDNKADHTWEKYTAAEAQLILQWIKQGAKNN